MTWLKIIVFTLAAIIAMGRLYVSDPGNPKLARILSILIVLSMAFAIVIELIDNHRKNRQQKKAEAAYKQIENLNSQNNELISQNNDLKQQSQLQIKEIQDLKGRMIDFQTMNTLVPGNKSDPPTSVRDKPPADTIKLYLGSCLAWWNSNVQHTYTLVNINNEPALKLSIDENGGLLISGKIRRNDGTEVINLIDNKYIRIPTVHIEPKRINENELIVLGNTGEKLLYMNFLNEKAIYIEGTFYDSQGTWILTIDENEIFDKDKNRFLPGASFGQVQNIFTYQTLIQRYQFTVTVKQPAFIDTVDRIDHMQNGKITEKPSEATIILCNTGTHAIRLGSGFDGEIEVDISGKVIYLDRSSFRTTSDSIVLDEKENILKFQSFIIEPDETKIINLLMQGEGKLDVKATLKGEEVIPKYIK